MGERKGLCAYGTPVGLTATRNVIGLPWHPDQDLIEGRQANALPCGRITKSSVSA